MDSDANDSTCDAFPYLSGNRKSRKAGKQFEYLLMCLCETERELECSSWTERELGCFFWAWTEGSPMGWTWFSHRGHTEQDAWKNRRRSLRVCSLGRTCRLPSVYRIIGFYYPSSPRESYLVALSSLCNFSTPPPITVLGVLYVVQRTVHMVRLSHFCFQNIVGHNRFRAVHNSESSELLKMSSQWNSSKFFKILSFSTRQAQDARHVWYNTVPWQWNLAKYLNRSPNQIWRFLDNSITKDLRRQR